MGIQEQGQEVPQHDFPDRPHCLGQLQLACVDPSPFGSIPSLIIVEGRGVEGPSYSIVSLGDWCGAWPER